MIERTDTSMSSPIMMLWFDLRVRTSKRCACLPARLGSHAGRLTKPAKAEPRNSTSVQRSRYFVRYPKSGAKPPPLGRKLPVPTRRRGYRHGVSAYNPARRRADLDARGRAVPGKETQRTSADSP